MKMIVMYTALVFSLCPDCVQSQWVKCGGPYPGGVYAIEAVPNGSGGTNILAGVNSLTGGGKNGIGAFVSTDNGTTWTTVAGLYNIDMRCFAVMGTKIFAAGWFGSVYVSTDFGVQWTNVSSGLPGSPVIGICVMGSNLFAGTYNRGVYRSTNGGLSWTEANNGITGAYTTYVHWFAVFGTNIFAGTGGGVFLSTDEGSTWNYASKGTNIFSYSVAKSGSYMFVGDGGSGVYLTTDNGTSWTRVANGMVNGTIESMSVRGTNLFAGSGDGMYCSRNNGQSWVRIDSGFTRTDITSNSVCGDYLFVGTGEGYIYRRSLSDFITLLSPTNNEGGVSNATTFRWRAYPQALTYGIQIATDANFTSILRTQYSSDTTCTLSNLQQYTLYYWRVRAENLTGASEWSAGCFRTAPTPAPSPDLPPEK